MCTGNLEVSILVGVVIVSGNIQMGHLKNIINKICFEKAGDGASTPHQPNTTSIVVGAAQCKCIRAVTSWTTI